MARHRTTPPTPPATDATAARTVRELMEHFSALTLDQLITEGQRIGTPYAAVDEELAAFLGVLLGRVALLEDRIDRLCLMARVTMN